MYSIDTIKKYKYILFDWDGCLARTLEVWLGAYSEALASHNVQATHLEIAQHLGDWKLGNYFGIIDHATFNTLVVNIARPRLQAVELYSGARELLVGLKDTKKLALVSSASRDILIKGLEHNGINDLFDVIISGEDVDNHKPHPEALVKALSSLGGTKEQAVMIGDSSKDMGAANNFGIDSVLMLHPSHGLFYDFDKLRDFKPTYTYESFSDLAAGLK